MEEQTFKASTGASLKYIFKSGRYDAKTLIVVFSGFGRSSFFTYDFKGESLSNCHSSILWIKDEINSQVSFYISTKNNEVEVAVAELIRSIQDKYNIANSDTLLLGASKGGFAAIYYAFKLNIQNVIASAPIIELGKFLQLKKEQFIPIYTNICGEIKINENKTEELDNILYSLIKNSKQEINIILLSSPNDELETCDKVYLHLRNNKNIRCNRIVAKTKAVYQHTAVTKYFRHCISGLCNIFSYCSSLPLLENDESIIDDRELSNYKVKTEPVAEITAASQSENCLNFKGVAFLKGRECSSYDSLEKYIILRNAKNEYFYPVGSVKIKELSAKYYEVNYRDYSAGGFATLANSRINMDLLEEGDYYIDIRICCPDSNKIYQCAALYKRKTIIICTNSHFIIITEFGEKAILRKVKFISDNTPDFFKIIKFMIVNEMKISIAGSFIVRSQNFMDWGSLSPYLILRKENPTGDGKLVCFKLAQKTYSPNISSSGEIGEYLRASFCDTLELPVDASNLENGRYEMIISCVINSFLFSQSFGTLVISNRKCEGFIREIQSN